MLLYLFSDSIAAQTCTLQGHVNDENGKSVTGAVILLFRIPDSTWSYSGLTDSTGLYRVENIEADSYTAKVIAQGFNQGIQTVNVLGDMTLDFSIQTANNTLKEVVVTDRQPAIETSFGKTTIHLNSTQIASGSNALDILRKAPGVRIDGQGNVSLNGTNVMILVDEKPTYLAGKDLETYLKSLSAEQLAQVELMSQPSAKYDKEGSGGIINLKTKTIRKKGFHGISSSSVSLAQRVHPAARSNLNLSYNNEKLSLFANAGYVHVQGFLDEKMSRTLTDPLTGKTSRMYQDAFYKETWEDYSLQIGMDYKLSSKTKAGLSIKGIYHPNKEKDEIHTLLEEGNKINRNEAERTHELFKNSVMGNTYLKYNPDDKTSLVVNMDYILRDYRRDILFDSKGYDEQRQPNGQDLLLHSDEPFITDLYSLKADYEKQMVKDIKLETGVKSSLVEMDNGSYFQMYTGSQWHNDTTRSNNFKYRENINALYANLAKKFSEKWSAQLGLRAENTNIYGRQQIRNKTVTRSFTSLFPVAYLGYKPSEHHNFEINYGRRITRPNYSQLNPFIIYTSQYQYATGNTELMPAFDHTIELRYNYNNMLFSGIEFRKRNNIINPVVAYDAASGNVIYTVANNADKNVIHASAHFMKELFKWWNFAASADMYYQAYKLRKEEKIASESVGYSFSVRNGFSFANWSVDSSYYWASGDLQSMIERNKTSQWLSLSVSKKLWKDTTIIKLSLEDPLNAYKQTMVSNWNGVETVSENRYLSQQISFGLTYNFGRQKENVERNNNHPEETKRM